MIPKKKTKLPVLKPRAKVLHDILLSKKGGCHGALKKSRRTDDERKEIKEALKEVNQ